MFLARAFDRAKDQSYFLSRIRKHKLHDILFPLGEMTKEEVRQERLRGLIFLSSEERLSQEICFIPDGTTSFLKSRGIEGNRDL